MDLADLIYDYVSVFPNNEIYGLISQMKRSATSVPSNIAEGSRRSTPKDFGNFILIAEGSLAELETQVLFSQRRKYGSSEGAKTILKEIDELHRMLHVFYIKVTTSVATKV
jgi:four helix bundle protein